MWLKMRWEWDEQTSPRVDHMQMTRPKSQTINTHAHGKYVSVYLFIIWLLIRFIFFLVLFIISRFCFSLLLTECSPAFLPPSPMIILSFPSSLNEFQSQLAFLIDLYLYPTSTYFYQNINTWCSTDWFSRSP